MGDRITQPNSLSRPGIVPDRAGQLALPRELRRGLVLHLDASRITGLGDGENVPLWADASGNGNDVAQATGTKQPTLQLDTDIGRRVVRFDGGDLLVDSSPLSTWIPFHNGLGAFGFVVAKLRVANSDARAVFLATHTTGTSTVGFHIRADDVSGSGRTDAIVYGVTNGDAGEAPITLVQDNIFPGAEWKVLLFSLKEQAGDDAAIYVDGDNKGTDEKAFNYSGANPAGQLHIGATTGEIFHLDGDIAELGLLDREDEQSDREVLQKYISRKYGIDIPEFD